MKRQLGKWNKSYLLIFIVALVFIHFYHGNELLFNIAAVIMFVCGIFVFYSVIRIKNGSHEGFYPTEKRNHKDKKSSDSDT